jgi:hypothetical protein
LAPPVTKAAAPIEPVPPSAFSESDDPLDELKQYLARARGFAVVNDYRSSDDAASFEDK